MCYVCVTSILQWVLDILSQCRLLCILCYKEANCKECKHVYEVHVIQYSANMLMTVNAKTKGRKFKVATFCKGFENYFWLRTETTTVVPLLPELIGPPY